jgi:hypothetical protein
MQQQAVQQLPGYKNYSRPDQKCLYQSWNFFPYVKISGNSHCAIVESVQNSELQNKIAGSQWWPAFLTAQRYSFNCLISPHCQ